LLLPSEQRERAGRNKQLRDYLELAAALNRLRVWQCASWPICCRCHDQSEDQRLHMYYNFARVHQTLRVTPAMEAGIANHAWSIEEIIGLLD
jgi:hypothetical protein